MELQLNLIPTISKDVIWRYEPQIEDGVVFIYHIEEQKIHEGNQALYLILSLISGERSIEDIINEVKLQYPDELPENIQSSVVEICDFFKEEKIILL